MTTSDDPPGPAPAPWVPPGPARTAIGAAPAPAPPTYPVPAYGPPPGYGPVAYGQPPGYPLVAYAPPPAYGQPPGYPPVAYPPAAVGRPPVAPGTWGPVPATPQAPAAPKVLNAADERRRAIASLVAGGGSLVVVVLGIVVWGGVGVALLIVGLLAALAGAAVAYPSVSADGHGMTARRRVAAAGFTISAIGIVLPVVALVVAVFGQPLGEDPAAGRPGTAAGASDTGAGDGDGDGLQGGPQPLSLGQPALAGDYTVTVDAVVMDADAAIAAADPANPAPVGQYVEVDLTVAYRGMTQGNPADGVGVYVVMSDGRTYYSAADCGAVTERPVAAIPAMEFNATASYSACVDVPPADLPVVEVLVEDLQDGEDADWKIWAVD